MGVYGNRIQYLINILWAEMSERGNEKLRILPTYSLSVVLLLDSIKLSNVLELNSTLMRVNVTS